VQAAIPVEVAKTAPAPVEAVVDAPAPAAAPAPVAAPAPAPAPAAASVADLSEMLGSAGLTLAATDPEKLRAAQEAAAKVAPPVRKPRERKPLPPQADEPLIQVDTRQ
jgi:ribonuclease E